MPRELWTDPYAAQAVDLLQQPAKARAAALQQIASEQAHAVEVGGNAQANAAIVGGQAWSGAAQQIGQIPQQIAAARMQSLQQQNVQSEIADRAAQAKLRDVQLQGMQREAASVDAGKKAIQASIETDPETGQSTVNHSKAADLWEQAGFPTQANAYRESVQKTQATAQQLTEGAQKIAAGKKQVQQAATDHLGELSLVGLDALKNKTPLEARDTTVGLVANAASHGLLSEDDAKQFLMQTAQASPDQLAGIFQKYLDAAPNVKEKALKDALTSAETNKNNAEADKARNPAAKSLQSKSVLVDGKPGEVSYNPADGSYQLGGQAIESGRVKPIPPASTIIQDQRNAALNNLPTWATDASRPAAGPEGNKIDPNVHMTPNGLFQAAQAYIATGQMPLTARGSDPTSLATRAAVTSKVGAIAADAGVDEPTLRALYKSNAGSLAQQQKAADAAAAFLATADKNSALLEQTLAKIPDTGSPLLNAPLRSLDQRALGSVDMAQFKTYLQSVQNEYAKILTQPTLSGQLTDSARKEAEQLVSSDATVKQIVGSLQALRAEGGNRLQSIGDQIKAIQGRMQGGASPSAPSAGETWVRDASGKLVKK